MTQRSSDSQRRIRILPRPRPEVLLPPSSRSSKIPPQARFAAPGKVDVLVKFEPRAFEDLLAHCAESNRHGREICGLLLGRVDRTVKNQGEGYRSFVTDILPFEATDASGAHVSANEDVWLRAEAQIEDQFPGKKRLGWYHTHPTQGIFFSGSDKDFHSIFTKPFQFALVIDPRFPEVGLFHWQDRQAGQIAGPIPLPLRTEPARFVVPKPTLADSHRLMLLALTLAGLVVFLAVGPSRLLPLAFLFTAALFLRLWNASAVPGQTSQDREFRIGPAATLLLGALLLPFFVAGVRLGTPLPGRWAMLSQKIQAPPPAPTPPPKVEIQRVQATPPPVVQESTAPDPRPTPRAEAPPRPIEIRPSLAPKLIQREVVVVQGRSSLVTLIWRNNQKAEYKADRKGRFQEAPKQETALLKYLLGVGKLGAEDYRLLQKAVGITDPDGSWGPTSRSTFIREVRKCARPGCEIKISSRTQDISIVFRRSG